MKTAMPSLALGMRVILNGQTFRIDAIEQDGKVRMTSLTHSETTVRVSLTELAFMQLTGKLKSAVPQDNNVAKEWVLPPAKLTETQHYRVARRIAYVNAVRSMYPIGPKNPMFRKATQDIAQRTKDPKPPSPDSVYRWLSRYVKSGLDTRVFLFDAGARRERKKRIEPEVAEILRNHLETLLSQKGATARGVTNEALALTARDTGYATFIAQDKTEHFVEQFLANDASIENIPTKRVGLTRKKTQ